MTTESKKDLDTKVTCLTNFRKNKELEEFLSRGREPLSESHLIDSNIKGEKRNSFQNRLHSIKSTLDKLNTLMKKINDLEKDKNSAK